MLGLYENHPSLFQQDLTRLLKGLMARSHDKIPRLTGFKDFPHEGECNISEKLRSLGTELAEGIHSGYPHLKDVAGVVALAELMRIGCAYWHYTKPNEGSHMLGSYLDYFHTAYLFAYGVDLKTLKARGSTTIDKVAKMEVVQEDALKMECREIPMETSAKTLPIGEEVMPFVEKASGGAVRRVTEGEEDVDADGDTDLEEERPNTGLVGEAANAGGEQKGKGPPAPKRKKPSKKRARIDDEEEEAQFTDDEYRPGPSRRRKLPTRTQTR